MRLLLHAYLSNCYRSHQAVHICFPQLFCIKHHTIMYEWGKCIHNSEKQQGTVYAVVRNNKLRRKTVEFVSAYGGWLHYTYCRSRWVEGNRIYDGWPSHLRSHPSELFICLSAYLFILSPRKTLTNPGFA